MYCGSGRHKGLQGSTERESKEMHSRSQGLKKILTDEPAFRAKKEEGMCKKTQSEGGRKRTGTQSTKNRGGRTAKKLF